MTLRLTTESEKNVVDLGQKEHIFKENYSFVIYLSVVIKICRSRKQFILFKNMIYMILYLMSSLQCLSKERLLGAKKICRILEST